MKKAITAGLVWRGVGMRESVITVRTEKGRDDFTTLSLADDELGLMIEIRVTPEVKNLLKGASK